MGGGRAMTGCKKWMVKDLNAKSLSPWYTESVRHFLIIKWNSERATGSIPLHDCVSSNQAIRSKSQPIYTSAVKLNGEQWRTTAHTRWTEPNRTVTIWFNLLLCSVDTLFINDLSRANTSMRIRGYTGLLSNNRMRHQRETEQEDELEWDRWKVREKSVEPKRNF